jgi:hypothetical protein
MPETIGSGWKRVSYKEEVRDTYNQQGQYSHVWQYVKGEQAILVSLDFAFRGWHTLDACYTNSGWHLRNLEIAKQNEQELWPWIECRMENDLGLTGHLWFALFDEEGKPYTSNMSGLELERRMDRNLWMFWKERGSVIFPMTFQCQIFIESGPPLTDEQLQELRTLFLAVREEIRTRSLPAVQKLGGK